MAVTSKHLTHFCYPIRPVLYQHLNSHVAYPGIPPEIQALHEDNICTCNRTLFSDYSDQSLTKLIHQKEEFRPVSYWSFTWLNRIALESLSMDTICDIIRDIDFNPTLDA